MFTVEEKQAYSEGLSLHALVSFLTAPHVFEHWHMFGANITYLNPLNNTIFEISEAEARAAKADIARLRTIHFAASVSQCHMTSAQPEA